VARYCDIIAALSENKLMPQQSMPVTNHEKTYHAPDTLGRISKIPPGMKMSQFFPGYGSNYRRLSFEQSAWTVTATCYSDMIHPTEDRILTAREFARLQSFPDTWVFKGPRRGRAGARLIAHVFAQIGNAVPPLLGYHVGKHLRDIAFVDRNDMSVVSLYSGAGGLDIGLEWAGFETRVCIEYDSNACDTLRTNQNLAHNGVHKMLNKAFVLEEDIHNLSSEEILSVGGLKKGKVGLVVGGPPCQPFSLAGTRDGFSDHRSLLLDEYLRVVKDLSPKGFIFENVKGIRSSQKGRIFQYLLDEFSKLGYKTLDFTLNAADYGVPQTRERVFIIGVRNKNLALSTPSATHCNSSLRNTCNVGLEPWITVEQAFEGLPPAEEAGKVAEAISKTIATRKANQDSSKLMKKKFNVAYQHKPILDLTYEWIKKTKVPKRALTQITALVFLVLAKEWISGSINGMSPKNILLVAQRDLGAEFPERNFTTCRIACIRPLLSANLIIESSEMVINDEEFIVDIQNPMVQEYLGLIDGVESPMGKRQY